MGLDAPGAIASGTKAVLLGLGGSVVGSSDAIGVGICAVIMTLVTRNIFLVIVFG